MSSHNPGWGFFGTAMEKYQVALILFSSLTETIGDLLRPHFATLQGVFVSGLNDQQSNRVRVAALKYAI